MADKLTSGESVKVLIMTMVMVGLVILVPIIIWTQIVHPAIADVKNQIHTVQTQ